MSDNLLEIHGERVTIRSTTTHDLYDLMTLWNDGRVMKWVGFPVGLGYNLDKLTDWFRQLQAEPHRHHFVVRIRGTAFCGELYYAVDIAHKRAGLDIKLIPEAQGEGTATDALKTLIGHVFESEPEIKAVWTEPSEENIAARRLYERCGLKPKPRPADLEPGISYWELQREDWIYTQET